MFVFGAFLVSSGYSKEGLQSATENDEVQSEPNYYTEKEYQVLKAEREKSGIYFIDRVAYLEEIVIPDLGHKLNRNDYANLVYMVVQTYYIEVNAIDAADSSIAADCDIIKILALNSPEVSKFKQASKKNTLNLKGLKDILEPYWSGEKLYPGETKSSHAALMKKFAKPLPEPATSSGNRHETK